MKKISSILFGLILALGTYGVVLAAPTATILRDVFPETTNTYYLGTSTKKWNGNFNNLTVSSCTGCATSTVGPSTSTYIAFFNSSSSVTGDPDFVWDSSGNNLLFPDGANIKATSGITIVGNVSGTPIIELQNNQISLSFDNAVGGGTARIQLGSDNNATTSGLLIGSDVGGVGGTVSLDTSLVTGGTTIVKFPSNSGTLALVDASQTYTGVPNLTLGLVGTSSLLWGGNGNVSGTLTANGGFFGTSTLNWGGNVNTTGTLTADGGFFGTSSLNWGGNGNVTGTLRVNNGTTLASTLTQSGGVVSLASTTITGNATTTNLVVTSVASSSQLYSGSSTLNGTTTIGSNNLVDSSNNKYSTSSPQSIQWIIENPTATENDGIFIFRATSTVSTCNAVNKSLGDTVTFNLGYSTSRATATSSLNKLFSSNQTVTATTTVSTLTVNGSTTPGTANPLIFFTTAASSSQLTITCYYTTT